MALFHSLGFCGGCSSLRNHGLILECRRPGFHPWVRKIPWRREWQPTPVFLPEEFHGQRSLAVYSPWGHKESDTTEQLTHTHTRTKFHSTDVTYLLYPFLRQRTFRLGHALAIVNSTAMNMELHVSFQTMFSADI